MQQFYILLNVIIILSLKAFATLHCDSNYKRNPRDRVYEYNCMCVCVYIYCMCISIYISIHCVCVCVKRQLSLSEVRHKTTSVLGLDRDEERRFNYGENLHRSPLKYSLNSFES